MKKILYINVTYKNASTGRIIKNIMEFSQSKDFDCRVLFQVGDNADEYSQQFEKKWENIVRRAGHKLFGDLSLLTMTETKRLIREIKKFDPDLIHIHTIHHQCLNYSMLFQFLQEYNKPVIITMHDCWVFTGGCYHYSAQKCDNFMRDCSGCPKVSGELDCHSTQTKYNLAKKNQFYQSMEKLYFTGVSKWICDEARKSIVKDKPIYTIRNGVDIDVFKDLRLQQTTKIMRQNLLNNKKYLVVGVASYWSESKGMSDFLHLAERLDMADYQIVLVGDKKEFGSVPANVLLYGRTDNVNELALIYNAADVLVNMSIEESFGLVTAEAAACGTPTVAYASTANIEIMKLVQNNLIEVGNFESLIEEVINVCNQQKKTIANYENIRKMLSNEQMVQGYFDLYEYICNK